VYDQSSNALWEQTEELGRTGVELKAVSLGDALEISYEELLTAALALACELGASLGKMILRHAQRVCQ
jgi:hypothetical protein